MVDHPMQDDPLHQILKGMIDELETIKEYRVRAFLVDDPDTAELYIKIAHEEIVHLGEFLAQAVKLDPSFKENLLKGFLENKSPDNSIEDVENEIEGDAE